MPATPLAAAAVVEFVALAAVVAFVAFVAFGTVRPLVLIFDAVTAQLRIFAVPTELGPSLALMTALFLSCLGPTLLFGREIAA
jgi:hypothetical protein